MLSAASHEISPQLRGTLASPISPIWLARAFDPPDFFDLCSHHIQGFWEMNNVPNQLGLYPLHVAAKFGSTQMTERLLSLGAS